jgi:tetratricopeptide (TPR) repeat protein
LAITRDIGHRQLEGATLSNLGVVYADRAEPTRALRVYEKAFGIFRQLGDLRGEASVLWGASLLLHAAGARARAIDLASEALAIYDQTSDGKAPVVRKMLAEWRRQASRSG